jgi:hypothetical protein
LPEVLGTKEENKAEIKETDPTQKGLNFILYEADELELINTIYLRLFPL